MLAPGGTLVVIDKNKEKLGALEMPSWERWFDAQELTTILTRRSASRPRPSTSATTSAASPTGSSSAGPARKPRPACDAPCTRAGAAASGSRRARKEIRAHGIQSRRSRAKQRHLDAILADPERLARVLRALLSDAPTS